MRGGVVDPTNQGGPTTASASRWRWNAVLEPLTPMLLAVHGLVLRSENLFSSPAQVSLVGAAGLVGVAGLVSRSPSATRFRAWLLAAITIALLVADGGVNSFFTLWLFMLAPVYGLLLGGRQSLLYPPVVGLGYLAVAPFTPGTLPPAVLWGRVVVIVASGLIVAAIAESQRWSSEQTRQAMAQVAYGRQLRQLIADSVEEAIIGVDEAGRISMFNRRAADMFGFDPAEIEGRPIGAILAPGADFGPLLATPSHRIVEVEMARSGGEVFPAEVSVGAVAGDGRTRTLMVVRDVSSQHAQRTMLTGLVKSKDEFLASVSHELRTPLTSVVGNAALLRDSISSMTLGEVSEFANTLHTQAVEVASIVEDLLVAARADIGQVTVRLTPVDLQAQVNRVVDDIVAGNPGRGRALTVDLDLPTPTTVLADEVRVRQIVRNLLTNAMRHGGPNTSVTLRAGEGTMVVDVADDGEPIDPRAVDSMFEPYGRANADAATPASIGLGLSVSRTLAELMGGRLDYLRRRDRNVFRLELPVSG